MEGGAGNGVKCDSRILDEMVVHRCTRGLDVFCKGLAACRDPCSLLLRGVRGSGDFEPIDTTAWGTQARYLLRVLIR
jgi:hypothetical protein